jgi:hypothetical protein
MRLESVITLSKGVATIKEITPLDFVLAIHLAIAKYGDIAIDEVEQDFWQTVWLENRLIALNGEFTEEEFLQINAQFSALNASIFQAKAEGSTQSANTKVSKKLSRVAKEIQTECALFISLFNYQAVFSYGFTFIQHLQKLHHKK